MANLDNMDLMMLQPHSDETKRMIGWLETDVNMALTNGYLHRLHFCVTRDVDGTDLIEQYTYTFTYGDTGAVLGSLLCLKLTSRADQCTNVLLKRQLPR